MASAHAAFGVVRRLIGVPMALVGGPSRSGSSEGGKQAGGAFNPQVGSEVPNRRGHNPR